MAHVAMAEQDRVHVQVLILYHLWTRGASSLSRLADALHLSLAVLEPCIDELTARRFAYELWPSPEGKSKSVYFLTAWLSRRLRQEFKDCARFRLEVLWHALQREHGGVPSLPPALAHSFS